MGRDISSKDSGSHLPQEGPRLQHVESTHTEASQDPTKPFPSNRFWILELGLRGTLGDRDPLNKVPSERARSRVQKEGSPLS